MFLGVSAFTNSSRNPFSKAGSPSFPPGFNRSLLNLRLLRSLKNSPRLRQIPFSFDPAWKSKTSRRPFSLTPITTSTGTFSTLSVTRILKLTPALKRYFTFSSDRFPALHRSTASNSCSATRLTSPAGSFRPHSLSEIIERVGGLIPARYIPQMAWRSSSSYILLRGWTRL